MGSCFACDMMLEIRSYYCFVNVSCLKYIRVTVLLLLALEYQLAMCFSMGRVMVSSFTRDT